MTSNLEPDTKRTVASSLREALEDEMTAAPDADALLVSRAIDAAMSKALPASIAPARPAAVPSLRPHTSPARVVRYALPLAAAFVASLAMAAAAVYAHRHPATTHLDAPAALPEHAASPTGTSIAPPEPSGHAMSVHDLPTALTATTGPGVQIGSPATAADLFREANAERRSGNTAKAILLYRQLETKYPMAPETQASRVSLGFLLLEKERDPKGALRQFDAFLESSGDRATLAEEARVGRAMSLEQLGRPGEERRAWEDLAAHHPQSLHMTHARERLRALDGNESQPREAPKGEAREQEP